MYAALGYLKLLLYAALSYLKLLVYAALSYLKLLGKYACLRGTQDDASTTKLLVYQAVRY